MTLNCYRVLSSNMRCDVTFYKHLNLRVANASTILSRQVGMD